MQCQSLTSGPRLWINTFGLYLPDRHDDCDCNCDCPCAYSVPVTSDVGPNQLELVLPYVKSGAVRNVSIHPDLFLQAVGDYTVAMSATEDPVVVLDDQATQLLAYLKKPSSIEGLKARFSNWTVEKLEHIITILLASGVLLSSPQMEKQSITPKTGMNTLAAWIHLTHQCNLSCQYCYVPKTDQRMDVSTAKRSVDAIYRSAIIHNYGRVRLKYAGGEPTLNFTALRAAHEQAERLSAQTGIELDAIVLTNGTLLQDSFLDFLQVHGIQVMVSLDGVGSYQDTQRPSSKQRERLFGRVANGLDRLLGRGILPHVSVTITEQNLEGLPALVEFLLDRELRFSFNFYREPDGIPTFGPLSFTSNQAIKGLFNAFRSIEQSLPKQSLLSNLSDRADLGIRHSHACGVGQNYLVIDSNGDVSKCQMDIDRPVTTINAEDPLAFVRADTIGIQNLDVDDKACRACQWRYRCAGGCPRLAYQHTGRYDTKSPLCDVYQAILPEIVRLEALRLIEYEKPWDFDTH